MICSFNSLSSSKIKSICLFAQNQFEMRSVTLNKEKQNIQTEIEKKDKVNTPQLSYKRE